MARTVPMIDVSFWQESNRAYPPIIPMDWSKAAAKGVQGAYIKVSQGQRSDPATSNHNALAGAHNIKRGGYHYMENAEGQQQAIYYLNAAAEMPWEMSPALDVEVKCYAKDIWAWVWKVYAETSQWPLIYTSEGAWGNVTDGPVVWHGRTTTYKQLIAEHCYLWQAQYPNPEYDDGYRIIEPRPLQRWESLDEECIIHQYSAKNELGAEYGSMGSISIDLDLADPIWFERWPWPNDAEEPPVEPPPVEPPVEPPALVIEFEALVASQNVRSEPSTALGGASVIGTLERGQSLCNPANIAVPNGSEVWLYFAELSGWVALVYRGVQFLRVVE